MSFSHNALTLGADVLRKVPSNVPKHPDINHFLLEFGRVLNMSYLGMVLQEVVEGCLPLSNMVNLACVIDS